MDFAQLLSNKKYQTISACSYSSATPFTVGDSDRAITCTASSGLACALTTNNASYCTIVSTALHAVGAGACVAYCDQAGNGNHFAAAQANQGITVTAGGGSVAPAFITGHVQSVYANSALTITGVTVHNALIAGMSSGVDLATTTLSGGCGVSWQYSSVIHTTDVYSKVAWCPDATAGSNAVSVTNGGGDFGWGMAEYSGLTAAGTLDGTPLGADTSSANPSSETIVTSYNNSLIIVMCGDEATAGTPTPGAGYTIRVNQNDHYHYMFDHIQTTAGATSMTTTRVASGSWQTLIIGFKAANP
jgi:hypothetical protein